MWNRSAFIVTLTLFTGWTAGCGNVSSTPDASEIDAVLADTPVDTAENDGFTCTAGEMLSCSGNAGVRCASDGTTMEPVTCPAGCHATEVRCNQIDASNGLNTYLDSAAA